MVADTRRVVAVVGAARLDRLLAEHGGLTRSRAQVLIEGGRVTVDGVVAEASSAKVPAGAVVEVEIPSPVATDLVAEDLPLTVLHADKHLAVVVKPAGMVTHPSKGHARGTLVNALLHHLPGLSVINGEERPGIVHRLDRGTSGVMVVARSDRAMRGLQAQFTEHTIDRQYLALVVGEPDLDAGTLTSWIGRHPTNRLRMASLPEVGEEPRVLYPVDPDEADDPWTDGPPKIKSFYIIGEGDEAEQDPAEQAPGPGGRWACTKWAVEERLGRATLVRCTLLTGRTHQVRVHLSEQGWPIAGDVLYSNRRTPHEPLRTLLQGVDHPLLHATRLAFEHPVTGRAMEFEVPVPEDYQGVLDGLRASPH